MKELGDQDWVGLFPCSVPQQSQGPWLATENHINLVCQDQVRAGLGTQLVMSLQTQVFTWFSWRLSKY